MPPDAASPKTKRDLVIAVWEDLDCESVGAKELKEIQRAVGERFGPGAVESPAALARTLADEGARLRHPEVLEADAEWRTKNLLESAGKVEFKFSNLSEAAETLREFESSRRERVESGDQKGLREFRDVVIKHKQDRLLIAKSSVLSKSQRAEAKEIADWLDVWLRTPELIADWLELRRSSPEFRRLFGPGSDGPRQKPDR